MNESTRGVKYDLTQKRDVRYDLTQEGGGGILLMTFSFFPRVCPTALLSLLALLAIDGLPFPHGIDAAAGTDCSICCMLVD